MSMEPMRSSQPTGYSMAKAVVDPEELQRFISALKRFNEGGRVMDRS